MLDVSLPLDWILNRQTPDGDILQLFHEFGEWEVGCIELRDLYPTHDPVQIRAAMDFLWEHGFRVSVRSSLQAPETAVAACLAHLRQDRLNITLAPAAAHLVPTLRNLREEMLCRQYPVTLSVENDPLLYPAEAETRAAAVAAAVAQADCPHIGICLDLGHYAYGGAGDCTAAALAPVDAFGPQVTHPYPCHGAARRARGASDRRCAGRLHSNLCEAV